MLIDTLGTARDLGRLKEIAGVFIRHGLGDAVHRLGLADSLQRAGHVLHWEHADELERLAPPVQLRRAREELGPTFVKPEQILAGWAGLFGPDWIAEFARSLRRELDLAGECYVAHVALKMIVEDGFFHADPHLGNVFYLPGNRIAFIDFGMVGRVSPRRREDLLQQLLGLVERRPAAVAEVLLRWASDQPGYQRTARLGTLEDEIETFVEQHHGTALADINLGEMLLEVTNILREHRLALPADLALLIKAFISLEGMGRGLDPGFQMAAETLPLLRARYRLQVGIEIGHLKHLGDQIDRVANRLSLSLVVAALIIGASIVMTVGGGPTLLGLPAFGLVGFASAAVGGPWLLRSMWRGGHPRSDRDGDDERR